MIRLEISAPGLPSLSFFDLPGVVVQDADMDAHVPKMIRNLVKSYIVPSKSQVLLTLPIDIDRANSSAADLVFKAKAEDRTIGIISKPDKLVDANVRQWREILEGNRFKLNLGYRVVRNPDDPNIDHAEARQQEQRFFNTDPIFSGPLGMFQDRFGTERLKDDLSELLMTKITECLPEIRRKIADRVTRIREELGTLPKPPSGNIFIDIQGRLLNFERQLTATINNSGNPTSERGWFQLWHRESQVFFEKLIQTAPEFDTATISTDNNGARVALDVDSDSISGRQAPTGRSPVNLRSTSTITPNSFGARQRGEIDTAVSTHTKKFTLFQLRNYLHAVNGGVYGTSDPRVFEQLVRESTVHWFDMCEDFLQYTATACNTLVNNILKKLFADLINTQLFQVIQNSVKGFLKKLGKKQAEMSERLSNIELGKPFTLDREIQETSKQLILEQLTEQSQKAICSKRVSEMKDAGVKVSNAERRKILDQIKIEPNHNHQELNELAGAIAYYRIAARRFADNNCLTIRNEFFHEMMESLWRQISIDIGLGRDSNPNEANEHLKRLTAPSLRDYNRRKELESERELLEQTGKEVMDVVHASQRRKHG